jgi:hypothetical protein
MTIENMFEQDADALRVKDNDIEGLAALARRAKELEKEIKDLESSHEGKKLPVFQANRGVHSRGHDRPWHEVF